MIKRMTESQIVAIFQNSETYSLRFPDTNLHRPDLPLRLNSENFLETYELRMFHHFSRCF